MNLLNILKTNFLLSLQIIEDEALIGTEKIIPNKNKFFVDYKWLFSPILSKEKKLQILNVEFNKFDFSVTAVNVNNKTKDLLFTVKDAKGRFAGTIDLIKGEWING